MVVDPNNSTIELEQDTRCPESLSGEHEYFDNSGGCFYCGYGLRPLTKKDSGEDWPTCPHGKKTWYERCDICAETENS